MFSLLFYKWMTYEYSQRQNLKIVFDNNLRSKKFYLENYFEGSTIHLMNEKLWKFQSKNKWMKFPWLLIYQMYHGTFNIFFKVQLFRPQIIIENIILNIKRVIAAWCTKPTRKRYVWSRKPNEIKIYIHLHTSISIQFWFLLFYMI